MHTNLTFLKKLRLAPILLVSFWATTATAQVDTAAVEEDYSKYDNLQVSDGKAVKRYCTQKVFGQSPARLISIGYDVMGGFTGKFDVDKEGNAVETEKVSLSNGLRLEANFPVVSKNSIIWNVGAGYNDHKYNFADKGEGLTTALPKTLGANALRNLSVSTTLFKPLDEKNFILAQALAEYAGDWSFDGLMPASGTKLSGIALYGRKPSDRKMWGVGVTRTYRAGEVNYLPVVLFNYSAPSLKWGVEILAPARADFRYSFTAQNILRAGVELEGTSFRLNNKDGAYTNTALSNIELRRSELKLRGIWDVSIKGFYWLSVSAGYRTFYRFNTDSGTEVYRGFGLVNKASYLAENKLSGSPFVSVSINLVSP